MSPDKRKTAQERRQKSHFRVGLAISVLLHALIWVFFMGQSVPPSPFSAAGERRDSDRAARGGGMQALELSTPTQEVVPPPPLPVAAEEEVPVEPEPEPEPEVMVEVPAIALEDGAGPPGDPAPELGPGLEDGDGQGDGGTEAEGRFTVVPPRPRGLILPPGDRPGSVRGKEVEVWVYVTAEGSVVPDSTQLRPPTGDRGFDRRLREYASGWVFEAALQDGRPVGEWFRYTIVM